MITSNYRDLELKDEKVGVGFRPSGELHVGNLLSIAYAAVIAEKEDLELEIFCCDTDWSAHIHSDHVPGNSDVMRLFFERDCSCGEHANVAEHRAGELEHFLEVLSEKLDTDAEIDFLSDIRGEEHYVEALGEVLSSIDELDQVFGGGFRRRYRSPVVNVCDSCGFSHSKGSAYSEKTEELVSACRNKECKEGFAASNLSGKVGVYYLVDPVRDPGRGIGLHVFGGDYRNAEKEMKTPKIEKVEKITEIACGQTPDYFLAPLVVDEEGKPLSKSKSTGKTVSDIDNMREFTRNLLSKVENWLDEEKKYVSESDLL